MSATSTKSEKKTTTRRKPKVLNLVLIFPVVCPLLTGSRIRIHPKKDINDTVAKLEERAESYSTEYAVYPVGDDRITVEIPGVYDANAVLEDLGSPGSLYFYRTERFGR